MGHPNIGGIWNLEKGVIDTLRGARSEVRKEILFEASAITDSAQCKRGRPTRFGPLV